MPAPQVTWQEEQEDARARDAGQAWGHQLPEVVVYSRNQLNWFLPFHLPCHFLMVFPGPSPLLTICT